MTEITIIHHLNQRDTFNCFTKSGHTIESKKVRKESSQVMCQLKRNQPWFILLILTFFSCFITTSMTSTFGLILKE